MMTPAVYRMFAADGELIYIGSSSAPLSRLYEHDRDRRSPWSREVVRVEVEHYDTLAEARAAEVKAIAAEGPRYNWIGNPARSAVRPHESPRPAPSPSRRAAGALIRQARERAGLTRQEVADRCGVTSASICHWENGRTAPTLRSQEALRDAIGLDIGADFRWVRAS